MQEHLHQLRFHEFGILAGPRDRASVRPDGAIGDPESPREVAVVAWWLDPVSGAIVARWLDHFAGALV
jgi:hypothetical protein